MIQVANHLADAPNKAHQRLALTEPEAASLLGIRRHVLRDARYRGEVAASRLGKRIVYRPDDLTAFLDRNRV